MDDPFENKDSIIEIDTKTELAHQVKQRKNIFENIINYNSKYVKEVNVGYVKDDIISKKGDHQIVICQDGKFVATFDTGSVAKESDSYEMTTKSNKFKWSFDMSNMYDYDKNHFIFVAISRINIVKDMKETCDDIKQSDYKREYLNKKKFIPTDILLDKNIAVDTSTESRSDERKGIAIYRIKLNLIKEEDVEDIKEEDIIKEVDVKEVENEEKEKVENKNYVLKSVTCYYSNNISGICKFIEVTSEEDSSKYDSELRRFIILNFRGIYNIEFNDHFDNFKLDEKYEKFEYPKNFRRELDNWYKDSYDYDCMNRIHSCIYNKYFLVTRYKDGVQSLEVYDLEKMEHEIDAILIENIIDRHNNYTFSVSRLQLCFAQVNIIKLFHIENGLQIASKKFEEIERIYLLEFIESDEKLLIIGDLKKDVDLKSDKDQEKDDNKVLLKIIIWDLYGTGKHKLKKLNDFSITKTNIEKDIYNRLTRTSGKISYIDDHGNVSSVLVNAKKLKPKDVKNKEKKILTKTGLQG
ncbi:unnamed protein product [Rhizophagus irregularis]|nr:unnamed protein product [Rhizophagus irregularis]